MKDIGNLCTHCHNDTSFGSGRFVNRIPSTTDDEDGYMCAECQSEKCGNCHELTFEGQIFNGEWYCYDCYVNQ
jgi:hypothetical protein